MDKTIRQLDEVVAIDKGSDYLILDQIDKERKISLLNLLNLMSEPPKRYLYSSEKTIIELTEDFKEIDGKEIVDKRGEIIIDFSKNGGGKDAYFNFSSLEGQMIYLSVILRLKGAEGKEGSLHLYSQNEESLKTHYKMTHRLFPNEEVINLFDGFYFIYNNIPNKI